MCGLLFSDVGDVDADGRGMWMGLVGIVVVVVVVVVATSRSPHNLWPFWVKAVCFSLPDPARAAVLSSGGS